MIELVKMRNILLLLLLFSTCGAQSQSTQTEVQSSGVMQTDVSADVQELRDMVFNLGATVVELTTTLSLTQNELQDTKALLYDVKAENEAQNRELTTHKTDLTMLKERLMVSDTKVKALEQVNAAQEAELTAVKIELTEVKTRLTASETEMVNLKTVTASQTERLVVTETNMKHVKNDAAAQHTDLTTMKAEVINLNKANAAQETRLSASETEVENLKTETAAQEAELTAVKTRLAVTETDVVNLEKEITEKPKVAFSAGLGISGYLEAPADTNLDLIFVRPITNVGYGYNGSSGFFTAPVKGVYYFRFTVCNHLNNLSIRVKIMKNGVMVMSLQEYDTDGAPTYLSSGVTLQLEVGDKVNLQLPAGHRLFDTSDNHSVFSGFLLFTL